LSAAQLLWREFRDPTRGQWNVDQRREERRVFGWVETDQTQSVLEIGQALCDGQVCGESLATTFGDWMQRSILQQLRRRPLDPGVRRLAKTVVKFRHQPRFAQARLAHDERKLAFALARAFPAPAEKIELFLAPDEGG
jgi:hypothetical protein